MRGSSDAGYFHVCTDGRALPWMFQDDSDFIAGINRIGISLLRSKVKVTAYVLMDNHVHFVLYGTLLQCKAFITLYKQLTGTWIHAKYGLTDFLKFLPTEMLYLDTDERLLNTIAYITRNPVVAGYRYLPTEYPWGSAGYLFKGIQKDVVGKPLSSMSRRSLRQLLNTRFVLPGNWRVDDRGMICPTSYMDVSELESFFRTPARYSYFLAKKLEGTVEQEMAYSQKMFLPDSELREIVKRMIANDYGKDGVVELDLNERLAVARKLRYRYASTIRQIARMVHLDRSALENFL